MIEDLWSAPSAEHPATPKGALFFQNLLLICNLLASPSHFDIGGMWRYGLLLGAGCTGQDTAVIYITRKACRLLRRTFPSPGERKLEAVCSRFRHWCAFHHLPEIILVLLRDEKHKPLFYFIINPFLELWFLSFLFFRNVILRFEKPSIAI